MKCQECERRGCKKLHNDPRNPPLDVVPCLCDDCYYGAVGGLIADTEELLFALRKQVKSRPQRRARAN